MGHRRHQQPPVVPERDEPAIEEMIDRRREQQPVLAVEPLGVVAVAPRLAVAGAQVLGAVDPGDAAALLRAPARAGGRAPAPAARARSPRARSPAMDGRPRSSARRCSSQRASSDGAIRRSEGRISATVSVRAIASTSLPTRWASCSANGCGELGQVDALEPAPVGLERRVLGGQERPQQLHPLDRPDDGRHLLPRDVDPPADSLPVAADVAELPGLGVLVGVGGRDAERRGCGCRRSRRRDPPARPRASTRRTGCGARRALRLGDQR